MGGRNKNISFKRKCRTVIVAFVLLAAAAATYFTGVYIFTRDKILRGIFVNDIDIGRMTREEALDKLNNEFNERIKNSIISIKFKDKEWEMGYKELNAHFDVEKAVGEAYKAGRDLSPLYRAFIETGLRDIRMNIRLSFLYDESRIYEKVESIVEKIRKKPVDAKISFDGKKFNVVPDVPGVEADEDKLLSMIKYSLDKVKGDDIIDIPTNDIKAYKTADMLKAVNTKISVFYTSFGTNDINRTSNIAIGTKAVNGTLIMPGEIFSLNKILGPRMSKYGYKEAPVIINGELVQGVGGGVCQVASTLYNAVLLADLDIVERKNHGIPSSYIELGRDATISEGYIDLKFKNNRKYPVYIYGYILGNQLYFEIYGDNSTPGMRVDITTDIVAVIKPKEPKITEDKNMQWGMEVLKIRPKDGYRVKSYRKTYINGKLVRNEQLAYDYYRPVNGEIIRGTKTR